MDVDDFASITLQGNQNPHFMNLVIQPISAEPTPSPNTFYGVLHDKLKLQPLPGGFITRADAILLQAYLTSILGL